MKTTSASISPAVRSRARPCSVEAQNAQPIAQPACVEMQMLLPYGCRMSTDSTAVPSANASRYLLVLPSFDCRMSFGVARKISNVSESFARKSFERFVISSNDIAPFSYIHCAICFARNFGRFRGARTSCSSATVIPNKFCFIDLFP